MVLLKYIDVREAMERSWLAKSLENIINNPAG